MLLSLIAILLGLGLNIKCGLADRKLVRSRRALLDAVLIGLLLQPREPKFFFSKAVLIVTGLRVDRCAYLALFIYLDELLLAFWRDAGVQNNAGSR